MILPGFPRMMPMVGGDGFLDLNNAANFDGTNDWLYRASLTGNADSAQFTISFWFYENAANAWLIHTGVGSSNFFLVYRTGASNIDIIGQNAFGTFILNASISASISSGQWYHVLISFNLANSSQRHAYVNGSAASVTWTTYTSGSIRFGGNNHSVGARSTDGTAKLNGRMAHVFLDHTYRDISDAGVRSLFYGGAETPTDGLATLSPIIYLPLVSTNPYGENLGTGGDYTVNGDLS